MADTERVTNQLQTEIYGITSDEQMQFMTEFSIHLIQFINNNPSLRLKHPGVPDSSDSSDGTSYPLTDNYTLPVTPATGRVA
jgi:hypothetical protein